MPLFNKKKNISDNVAEEKELLCENISFAASEAYKLLRTNIAFSLPDEKKCRVVGITSAVRNEGKSTTSINLSYALAWTGKKVLTIEGDMRLPNLGRRLGLKNAPGLSNLLAGLAGSGSVLQDSGYFNNWKIITSGDIPPNPSELLGSSPMRITIEKYAESFDYIIIDLPPVNIVSDALVVSKITDGMLMTVREDYSDKTIVTEAVNSFRLSGAKLLGFVLTCAESGTKSGRYGKYGKYGKYGRYGKYGKYGSYSYDYRDTAYGYESAYSDSYEESMKRFRDEAAKENNNKNGESQ